MKSSLLKKLGPSKNNVSFRDFVACIEAMGFKQKRVAGSHFIFTKDGVDQLVNIQSVNGKAKPYQVSQFLRLVERHGIKEPY